jgi:nucleotide-binding universal stress UspA family protein
VFGKIMLAWDGSENAALACKVAYDLARHYGARLVAVSVTHAPEHAELPGEKERALEEARAFYARKLEPLVRESKVGEVVLKHEVIPGGHPAETLIEYARHEAFDLIVIGRRGMGRSSWFRIGSVSDRVARYAHCPVMVVGHGE